MTFYLIRQSRIILPKLPPIHEHLQLHASQYKQKTQHSSHPFHKHTTYVNTPRPKNTIFYKVRYTTNIPTDNRHTTNMPHIHTYVVSMQRATRGNNKILCTPPPHISSFEEILPRITPRTLAQLRTNKSPFLKSYLHKADTKSHPSPLRPLCNTHTHDISSTAPIYEPHYHSWICGQTPPESLHCWLVDLKREDRTPPKGHRIG